VAAANLRVRRGRSLIRNYWFLTTIPIAAAVLIIIFLISPSRVPTTGARISEIRTQFELIDKNIKVIFIQKPDFIIKENTNE
jgi:hypothetical protein